jgi:hypothetical protein
MAVGNIVLRNLKKANDPEHRRGEHRVKSVVISTLRKFLDEQE